MTQTDSNREAFEAWWGTLAPPPPDGPTDPYPCSHQSISLEAWQAATAQALRPIISILHPNGIKHPQQLEPEWVVKGLEERMNKLRDVREAIDAAIELRAYKEENGKDQHYINVRHVIWDNLSDAIATLDEMIGGE